MYSGHCAIWAVFFPYPVRQPWLVIPPFSVLASWCLLLWHWPCLPTAYFNITTPTQSCQCWQMTRGLGWELLDGQNHVSKALWAPKLKLLHNSKLLWWSSTGDDTAMSEDSNPGHWIHSSVWQIYWAIKGKLLYETFISTQKCINYIEVLNTSGWIPAPKSSVSLPCTSAPGSLGSPCRYRERKLLVPSWRYRRKLSTAAAFIKTKTVKYNII